MSAFDTPTRLAPAPSLIGAAAALVALSGCAELGVQGPTVCEEWVKPQLENPESYTWKGSHWKSGGHDVIITFTAELNGRRKAQHAECNFVDPDAEQLRIDPDNSAIRPFEYEDN